MKNKILLLILASIVVLGGFKTTYGYENFFYTVQKDDTIHTIAKNHNVSEDDIILHNKQILNNNFLKVNEYINVPSKDNQTFGVLYKSSAKNTSTDTLPVSNFTYTDTYIDASDTELEIIDLINDIRKENNRLALELDDTLFFMAKDESEKLLSYDLTKLEDIKDLPKKMTFYNSKYKYAGLVSLIGQKSTGEIVSLLEKCALNDYIINPDFSKVGVYVHEMNDILYTSLYFVC